MVGNVLVDAIIMVHAPSKEPTSLAIFALLGRDFFIIRLMLAIGRNLSCSFAIPLSSLSDMAIAESYLMKSPVDLSDNILIYK